MKIKISLALALCVSVFSSGEIKAQTKSRSGKELETLLPQINLSGYERQKPETSSVNMNTEDGSLSIGSATVDYIKSNGKINVTIIDYLSDKESLEGMCSMIQMNMSMETDEVSIKIKPYKNTKLLENIDKTANSNERKLMLFLCYKDRYYIAIEGTGVKDIGVLYNLLNDINLGAL